MAEIILEIITEVLNKLFWVPEEVIRGG